MAVKASFWPWDLSTCAFRFISRSSCGSGCSFTAATVAVAWLEVDAVIAAVAVVAGVEGAAVVAVVAVAAVAVNASHDDS